MPLRSEFFSVCRAFMTSVCSLLVATFPCYAQCDGKWLQGPGQGVQGTSSKVRGFVEWDRDGIGPLPSVLVTFGDFKYAGDTVANEVAMWNGVSWTPCLELGAGSHITAMTVHNNQLVVATITLEPVGPDTYRVSSWDGTTLTQVGSEFDGTVRSFTVFGGELIAVGDFTTARGDRVARWSGTEWAEFPSAPISSSQSILSACVLDGDLYVAFDTSSQNAIHRWNGVSWSVVGSPSLKNVKSIAAFQGSLVAGGSRLFQGAGTAFAFALWNGSTWTPMGGAIETYSNQPGTVYTLEVHGGELFAGGSFDVADGNACGSLVRWAGSSWQPVVGDGVFQGFDETRVWDLCPYQGSLFVGGNFTIAGGEVAANIAEWDGTQWSTLGTGFSTVINASVIHNGSVVVGGPFTVVQGQTMNSVARWDGSTWHAMPGLSGTVNALEVYNNELIAAGDIYLDGEPDAISVARWTGMQWTALPADLFGTVKTMTLFNNELIAAGDFSGGTRNFIARWNGSVWRSLGSGVNGRVSSLAVFNGHLYVGGRFSSVSGVPAKGIARWTGTTWQAVGSGVTSPPSAYNVTALGVHGSRLVASCEFGSFAGLPSGISAWDGTSWQLLVGSSGSLFGECFGFTTYNSDLIAYGPGYGEGLARWDGVQWNLFPTGVTDAQPALQSLYGNASAHTAVVFNGDLFLGGNFQAAGHHPSAYWARWRDFVATSLDQHPVSRTGCGHEPAQFDVLASGSESLTYQWQWLPTIGSGGTGAWLDIEDGSNDRPSSHSIAFIASGSDSPSLILQDTRLDTVAADGIRCVVSTSCDSIVSGTASLTVCFANLNCDARVDIDDLLAFLDAFGAGTQAADLDDSSGLGSPDGGVDVSDLLFFLARFEAGC